MMTRKTLVLALAALLAGCNGGRNAKDQQLTTSSGEHDGVQVTLEVPQRLYQQGQMLTAKITVANVSGRAVDIIAPSGAEVHLTVMRYADLAWERVDRYPQVAIMVMTPWTLPAGQSRSFSMSIPVEPSWPTGEALLLRAEINGLPQPRPSVQICVQPPAGPGAK